MARTIESLETPSGNTWELRESEAGNRYAVASHRKGKQPVSSFNSAKGGVSSTEGQQRDESGRFVEQQQEDTGETIRPPDVNYRSMGILYGEYDGDRAGDDIEYTIEVFIITDEPRITQQQVRSKLNEIRRKVSMVMPIGSGRIPEASIELNREVRQNTHGWKGIVYVERPFKSEPFTYDYKNGKLQWEGR